MNPGWNAVVGEAVLIFEDETGIHSIGLGDLVEGVDSPVIAPARPITLVGVHLKTNLGSKHFKTFDEKLSPGDTFTLTTSYSRSRCRR